MTNRYYPSFVTVSKDAADKAKRDRFHEAAFLAALQGLCANPHMTAEVATPARLVATSRRVSDAALDQYPFITDDEQLTKGKTQ